MFRRRPTAGCVYAGPFRSYGQVLILNAGDGYHIVLAGMERIDATLGQFVLAGEPVASWARRGLAQHRRHLNTLLPSSLCRVPQGWQFDRLGALVGEADNGEVNG